MSAVASIVQTSGLNQAPVSAVATTASNGSTGTAEGSTSQGQGLPEALTQFFGLTSILLHRQQLLSQLYMTTASICQLRDQMSPVDIQCLMDQAQSLRWCALQQEWLAPSSFSSSGANLPGTTSSASNTAAEALRESGNLPALGVHGCSDHQTVIRVRHQVAAARLASNVFSEAEQKFFARHDADIARHIAKAKPLVTGHRWTPKKDPGEAKGKAPNMTVGTFEKFLGLSAYVASSWNNSNPPFQIKSMLSFSASGFVYCMACRYTYVNMHNDYRKVTEHFLSVSHLARCRELGNEESNPNSGTLAIGQEGAEHESESESESESEPESDSGPEMEPEPEPAPKKKEEGSKKKGLTKKAQGCSQEGTGYSLQKKTEDV